MMQCLRSWSVVSPVSPATTRRGRDASWSRSGLRTWTRTLITKSRAVALLIGLVVGGTLTQGCADHASHTLRARTALDAGNSQEAIKLLDEELDVERPEDVPAKLESDKVLLLLDRAMILAQMERYKLASRDLEVADKQLEILDFKRGTQDELAKYLFSDQSGPYRAPAYEKLLVNTVNMQCYLARGDLAGARVEARRLSVLERFFHDTNDPGQKLMGPGDYLAGFIFEKSGKNDEALRYYDSALALGDYESLADAVRRMLPHSSYQSARLQKLLDANPPSKGTEDPEKFAEVLVVVNYGRVPPKIAERVPIGLALTYASGAISPYDQARANRLAAQGLVTWVNFPRLGKPKGEYDRASFAIDGARQELDPPLAIDKAAASAWEDVQGKVVASAITRTIARIIAGQAVQKAAGDGITGLLLGLGTQATMTAADTPDTRSWSTLPARIAIGRVRVAPGKHSIEVVARGMRKRLTVDLPPGGWTVAVLSALR